ARAGARRSTRAAHAARQRSRSGASVEILYEAVRTGKCGSNRRNRAQSLDPAGRSWGIRVALQLEPFGTESGRELNRIFEMCIAVRMTRAPSRGRKSPQRFVCSHLWGYGAFGA